MALVVFLLLLLLCVVSMQFKKLGVVHILLLIVALAMFYTALTIKRDKLRIEKLEEMEDSAEGFAEEDVEAKLKKLRFLKGLVEEKGTHNLAQQAAVQVGAYNEDLKDVSTNLQFYTSIFSSKSYTAGTNSKKWVSIASNGNQSASMYTSTGGLIDSSLNFEQSVPFTQSTGFHIAQSSVKGPLCHQLGIKGDGEYSLFFFIQPGVFTSSTKPFELCKLFANTKNNNGLSIELLKIDTQGPVQTTQIIITHGAESPIICTLNGNKSISFQPGLPLLLIVSKSFNMLRCIMYNIFEPSAKILCNSKLSTTDNVFSNKELSLNANKNVNVILKAFGIYNTALNDMQCMLLYKHLLTEMKKTDEFYKQYAKKIDTLAKEVAGLQQCPYDAKTCNKCGKIKVWTVNNLLTEGDTECLQSIGSYCQEHSNKDGCKCWDLKNPKYKDAYCSNWRNTFKNVSPLRWDNLDKKTLENIKKKYNLTHPLPQRVVESPWMQKGALKQTGYKPHSVEVHANDDIATLEKEMKVLAARMPAHRVGAMSKLTKEQQEALPREKASVGGFFNWLLGKEKRV